MVKPPLSHFSPKFANKEWADDNNYISYFSCIHSLSIKKASKGYKQWGRQRGLYTWEVERALGKDLENDSAIIYKKILSYEEVNLDERLTWSQFLLSQLVRTPSFMKYEAIACPTNTPEHDRVGCKECKDLNYVSNRDWCLLHAHKDDFFVRSDNPVLQTGFIERPESCLFYPLSPQLCFVARSMSKEWNALLNTPKETCVYKLDKGGAHMINFHLSRAAEKSLIISPHHDGLIADAMYKDVLGRYPQPPFLLHILNDISNATDAYESIRRIMSEVDGLEYPSWLPMELESYY